MPTPLTLTAADGGEADVLAAVTTTPNEDGTVNLGLRLSLGAVRPPAGPPAGVTSPHTIDAAGEFTFTAPADGVYYFEGFGGGNGGADAPYFGFAGLGGAGAGYSANYLEMTAGQEVSGIVGAGGTPNAGDGAQTTVGVDGSVLVTRDAGGFSGGFGTVVRAGGGGGFMSSGDDGGGGGSSASADAAGVAATTPAGATLAGAGAGGSGGTGGGAGVAGTQPGGGGGGGGKPTGAGGAGGAGRVVVTWPVEPPAAPVPDFEASPTAGAASVEGEGFAQLYATFTYTGTGGPPATYFWTRRLNGSGDPWAVFTNNARPPTTEPFWQGVYDIRLVVGNITDPDVEVVKLAYVEGQGMLVTEAVAADNSDAIDVTFNQDVATEDPFSLTGLSCTVNGDPRALTYFTQPGALTHRWSIGGGGAAPGDAILLSYAPGNIVGSTESALAAFADLAVTNPA